MASDFIGCDIGRLFTLNGAFMEVDAEPPTSMEIYSDSRECYTGCWFCHSCHLCGGIRGKDNEER